MSDYFRNQTGEKFNAEMAWDKVEKAMVLLREKDEALEREHAVTMATVDALADALGKLERARALLHRVEWSYNCGQNSYECPACERENQPHAPDCELAALIGK